jgi:hypothetical protein
MKAFTVLALLFGLALVGVVALRIGIGPVAGAVARVGWLGFTLVVATGFALTVLPGAAFWTLLGRAPVLVFVAARQVRDSVGDLLPFTQFGGMMAGVRVLALGGIPVPQASAAAIVDVTAEFVAQIAFIVLGLVLATDRMHADPVLAPYVHPLMLGTALLVATQADSQVAPIVHGVLHGWSTGDTLAHRPAQAGNLTRTIREPGRSVIRHDACGT